MKLCSLTLFLFYSLFGFSQLRIADSTQSKMDQVDSPESRMRILLADAMGVLEKNPKLTIYYAETAARDSVNIDNPFLMDTLFRTAAIGYGNLNNRTKALENHLSRIRVLSEDDSLSRNLASAFYETAHVFLSQGNDGLAFPYLLKCRDVANEIGYDTQEGQVSIDLGNISFEEGNYQEALSFYKEAEVIFLGYERLLFVASYAQAKMAKVYSSQGDREQALSFANKALANVDTTISLYVDYSGGTYETVGEVYLENNMSSKGIWNLTIAQGLYERYDKFFGLPKTYRSLSNAYRKIDIDSSLIYLEWYVIMNDSVLNTENNNRITQMRFEFEEEQKDKEIKLLEQEKQLSATNQELAEADSERKSQSIRIVVLVLVLVVILLLASIYLFRNSRRQNRIVNDQKKLVEERNKEIEDSIIYAERIQRAVIPEKQRLNALFPESFCYYLPKDVLSGDFYWVYEVEANDQTKLNLFAVGDCTGHGVPGALLSILGVNYLNLGAVNTNVNSPGQALDLLNEGIVQTFGHSSETIRDGMDIVIGAINPQDNQLHYSCAKNPIYIIREGEVITLKGDKKAIGNDAHQGAFSFKDQSFQLEKNDMIYALSDGFQDQFGGEKGRKFKVKPMKDMLVQLAEMAIADQEAEAARIFQKWKGDYEQIDDVTFLGIRV